MRVRYDIHENFFESAKPDEKRRFEIIESEIYKYIRDLGAVICKEFSDKQGFSIDINRPKVFNALVDAFTDIRRIEAFHIIDNGPDQVKMASHVAFWFIRWQPCSIVPQEDFLKSTVLTQREKKKLLLLNENLMVTYLQAAVFIGGNTNRCMSAPFRSLPEWEGYYNYLLYYLVYRLRSPKELEAILKTITLHPLWKVQKDIYFGQKDEAY